MFQVELVSYRAREGLAWEPLMDQFYYFFLNSYF